MRLAIVAEGDASTRHCWSGCALGFVDALRRAGNEVETIDVELSGAARFAAALLTFHPSMGRWRERFRLGSLPFRIRSLSAARRLRRCQTFDAVIQIGATFQVSRGSRRGAVHVVYCDSNIAQALRGAPWSSATNLTREQAAAVIAREQKVYDGADRVWVWSEILSDSFRTDFSQPAEKLRTVGAGANREPTSEPPRRPLPGSPPSVLFVGKEFERKGLPMVLEAFRLVHADLPQAELHIAGCEPPGVTGAGVFVHGFLSWNDPDQSAHLNRLYERATVFCMPSRYEPFGVVFAEAMLNALPCIGANAWAMPEIIVPGETGWLVPDGDVGSLTVSLREALGDLARCASMGRAGLERARRLFTWDAVAERALADLRTLCSHSRAET